MRFFVFIVKADQILSFCLQRCLYKCLRRANFSAGIITGLFHLLNYFNFIKGSKQFLCYA